MTTKAARPYFNPERQEWQQQTGPNTWRVWKHGTLPGDEQRLLEEAAKELARVMDEAK